jgi:Flp pilus assembly protein CpaB
VPTNRGSSAIWFILSVVFALFAALIAHVGYQRYTSGTPVVVAVRFVGPMQKVQAGDVQLLNRPTEGLPGDALRTTAQAVGHYTLYGLVPGEVVQRGALVDKSLPGTALDAELQELAAAQSGQGYRAYVLPLDDKHGYTLPQPGDRVDILAQVKAEQSTEAGVLLQQVLVLAKVDGSGQSNSTPIPGQSQQQSATSGDLILALTQPEIDRLALAQAIGSVSVALAPPGSQQTSAPSPANQVFAAPQPATVPTLPATNSAQPASAGR